MVNDISFGAMEIRPKIPSFDASKISTETSNEDSTPSRNTTETNLGVARAQDGLEEAKPNLLDSLFATYQQKETKPKTEDLESKIQDIGKQIDTLQSLGEKLKEVEKSIEEQNQDAPPWSMNIIRTRKDRDR